MTRRQLPLLLDAHRHALSECRRCGYEDARVMPILSEARTPRVMLIGQAPGKTELGDRRAFSGRAGRTLFRWLERTGIDEATARREIYIAAMTRCYPGPSPSGRGDRVPSPRERENCSGWLERELALIRPALLIPVGRLAIDQFIGPAPLSDVIGREYSIRVTGRRARVIALPHPSGASSWVNAPANRALVDRALDLLGRAFREIGVYDLRTVDRRRTA